MCLFRYLGVTLHSNRTFFTSLQRLLTDNSMSHTKPKHETTKKNRQGRAEKKRRRDTPFYILERFYIRQGKTINNSKKKLRKQFDRKQFLKSSKRKEIRMEQTEKLVSTIIKGIQEKKGQGIKVVDLKGIDGTIASYFIICQGNSPAQVEAIAESVSDTVRIDLHEKATNCVGLENCQWVAIDFTDVLVHVFLPEARQFYDLDNLWQDAKVTDIPDLD